jgi:peptide/nickel transport system substrate-binding protein
VKKLILLLCTMIGLHGCGHQAADPGAGSSSRPVLPKRGGEATILLGSDFAGAWPTGLDPATDITGGANLSLMNAIYGGLLQVSADADGQNPQVIGVLAQNYEIKDDGKTIVLRLRQGVKFSDGTPFDAEAVRFNIERDLTSECTCAPTAWPFAPHNRVVSIDDHTVELHFSRPFGPAINSFPSTNLNWVVSPSALRALGEDKFKITPVGAGPFKVVTDQVNSKLVLERNPYYWQKDRPYLDRLTFQAVADDQVAYQAVLAGDAGAFEGMSTTPLIQQALDNKELTVTLQPATSPLVVQLNTRVPPFNNQVAREAIYYATNVEAIRVGLFHGWYPVSQSFTAPGGLFHHDTVPDYRTYDLAKARQAVKQAGGLSVTLGTLRSFVANQVITALQTQWKAAGIDVKVESYDLGTLIGHFQKGSWQAMLQTAGSYDPDAGTGLRFRFATDSVFSGVSDARLDQLVGDAAGTFDVQQRDILYQSLARYISDKAYAPFLVAQEPAQISRRIYGPGLTTKIPATMINTAVLWQDVWSEK